MNHLYLNEISSSVPNRVNAGSMLSADRVRTSADHEAVERFNKAMDEGEGSRSTAEDSLPFQYGASTAQEASSLFGMHGSFGALFAESVEQVAAPALSGPELDMLVERILVSSPESGGAEVRLILSGKLLNGTEIIIQRDGLGLLSVQLHANEAAAFQTLVASRNDLAEALERFESGAVRVDIEYSGENRDDSDAERRSKGLLLNDSPED